MCHLGMAWAIVSLMGIGSPTKAELEPGARVRVRVPTISEALAVELGSWTPSGKELKDRKRLTGTVLSFDDSTLALSVKGRKEPVRIPRSAIETLEVLVAAVPNIAAQLRPGTRVRVTAPAMQSRELVMEFGSWTREARDLKEHGRLDGSLVGIDEHTLTLRVGDLHRPLVVPRSTVERLEVSRGRHSRGEGALGGAVLLGVLSTLVAVFASDGSDWSPSPGEAFVVACVLGGAVGAAIEPGERWDPVSADQIRISVTPGRGRGIGLAVSIGF